jgi:FixJ family two-component response regulator
MTDTKIFIVDDDPDIREVLTALFRNAGYQTADFADCKSFVREARDQTPACILLDLCMPGHSGLEALIDIDARNYPAPIVILSGREDVVDIVQAMKCGAADYIEKRLDAEAIVARVADAIDTWLRPRRSEKATPVLSPEIHGYHKLTPRERQVLEQIAAAASNKETALHLGISPRTVEIHRSRIMHKLGAKNSVDLMRIVMDKRFSRQAA